MKVFEFHNADNQAYIYAPDEVCDRCNPDPPRSLAAGWSPPTFEIVGRDEYRSFLPKKDFITFTTGTMVLNARAVERLRQILEPCGEILPIHLSNDRDTVYLFNVTRLIDAVDMERSEFMELPSGSLGPCEKLVLDSAAIPADAFFFKTTQMGPASTLFATEAAVAAVKRARLTGHDFELV